MKFLTTSREAVPRKQVDPSPEPLPEVGSGKRQIGSTTILFGVMRGDRPHVEVYSVRTPATKRGKGSARAAMTAFLHQVDADLGLPVVLGASPLDKRTRLDRLVAFYRSLGFRTTGRQINAWGHPEMLRPAVESGVVESARVRMKPASEPSLVGMARDLETLRQAGGSSTPGLESIRDIYWSAVVHGLQENTPVFADVMAETMRLWRALTPADHRKISEERAAQKAVQGRVSNALNRMLPAAEEAGFWRWAQEEEAFDEESAARVDAARAGSDPEAREELLQDYLRSQHSIEIRDDGLATFDLLTRPVRLILGDHPVVLYHHTSDKIRARVQREGLHARGKAANPYKNSRAGVYLTTEASGTVVEGYQRRAIALHRGDPHTFEVRTTIPELKHDIDDAEIPQLRGRQFVLPEVPPDQILGLSPARKNRKIERLPVSPQPRVQASAGLPALARQLVEHVAGVIGETDPAAERELRRALEHPDKQAGERLMAIHAAAGKALPRGRGSGRVREAFTQLTGPWSAVDYAAVVLWTNVTEAGATGDTGDSLLLIAKRYGLGPRAKTTVERAIFAAQPGIKPAIQRALARLPAQLQNALERWQYVFQGGRQPLDDLLEEYAEACARAFRPVLQLLPARVRLYRGEPRQVDRTAPRAFLSWTDQRSEAEEFAMPDGLLRMADVPRDQILAVMEHGVGLEFLVRATFGPGETLPGERRTQAAAATWYIEIRPFDPYPKRWRALPGTAELRRAEQALRRRGAAFRWKPRRNDDDDYWSGAEPAADHGSLWFRAPIAIADQLYAEGFSVQPWNFDHAFPARPGSAR